MFDDPKRDLKRMEAELLAQEDESWLDRELAEARRLLDRDYEEEDAPEESEPESAPAVRIGTGAANTDRVDVDLDAYSDELLDAPPVKKEKGVRGLVILIVLELLGIAGLGAYWLMQLL